MPSQLIGLRRTLAWSDYGLPPKNPQFAAQTASNILVTPPHFQRSGKAFQLVDNVTLTVKFDKDQSWRIDMSQWPSALEQNVLDHEQAHYDITALSARDLFIQLMGEKIRVFSSEHDGQVSFNYWVNLYRANWKKIDVEYDLETGHSQANVFVPSTNLFTPPQQFQKGQPQQQWERLIDQAFTTPRPSGERSMADQALYKMELMDVLVQAGIKP